MEISYVICAAGLGTRTKAIGAAPKPFLKLNGKTLLEWSLESLPVTREDQVLVVLLEEHRGWIEKLNLPVDVMYIETLTRGQAETAFLAKNQLKHTEIVIFNADTYFKCGRLADSMLNVEGLIPCSIQEGNEWSFCEVTDRGDVISVQEKNRISDHCSVGFYYFKDSSAFFKLVEEALRAPREKELYVAPFYQELIERGLSVRAMLVDEFKPMGSVGQIEKFWGVSLAQLQAEN